VTAAVIAARRRYEEIMREPAPSDPETDAALAPLCDELLRDRTEAEEDLEAAKAWLAANG
jgi:hypothetical protein